MTLYELTGDWLAMYEAADDPDIDFDAWFDTIDGIDQAIEDKADGYAMVIAEMQNQAAGLHQQIQRLDARRRTLENRIKAMKEHLAAAMEATGKTKFRTQLFNFGLQNNAPTVVLDCDVEDLPKQFIKYAEPTADKKKIAELLKNGVPFQYAHLEQGRSLRIG